MANNILNTNGLSTYLLVSSRPLRSVNPTKVRLKVSDRRIIRGFLHKDSVESVAVYERLYLSILGPKVDNKDPYVVFFELRQHSLEDYVLKNRVDWEIELQGKPRDKSNPDLALDTLLDIRVKATMRTDLTKSLESVECGVPFQEVSPAISGYSEGRWKMVGFPDPARKMTWVCNQEEQNISYDDYPGGISFSDTRTLAEFINNRLGELKAVLEDDDEENLATAKRLASDSTLIDLEGMFELDLEWMKSQVDEVVKKQDPKEADILRQKLKPLLETRRTRLLMYLDVIMSQTVYSPHELEKPALFHHFRREYDYLEALENRSTEEYLVGLRTLPNVGWTKSFYWFMFLNSSFFETRLEQLTDPQHVEEHEPQLQQVLAASWQRDEEVPKVIDTLFDDLVVRWANKITNEHHSILKTPLKLEQWAGERMIVNREFSAWEMSGYYGVGISHGSITVVDVRERTSDHRAIGFGLRWFRQTDQQDDALKV